MEGTTEILVCTDRDERCSDGLDVMDEMDERYRWMRLQILGWAVVLQDIEIMHQFSLQLDIPVLVHACSGEN